MIVSTPGGCCRPSCCFLTSLPSLCSCTAPQSTLPLLPSSPSWLLCLLFSTPVLLQCLCTSVVSTAILWSYRPRTLWWPNIESSSCFPRTSSAAVSSPSFKLFPRVSTSLSRTQRAANFPPTLAWNTFPMLGSLCFSRSNQTQGLFMKHLVFSFNLMVVSTRPWSLPMLAPGKDLVFSLLMLGLKFYGFKMKSIWLWICLVRACQVAVLDNL